MLACWHHFCPSHTPVYVFYRFVNLRPFHQGGDSEEADLVGLAQPRWGDFSSDSADESEDGRTLSDNNIHKPMITHPSDQSPWLCWRNGAELNVANMRIRYNGGEMSIQDFAVMFPLEIDDG